MDGHFSSRRSPDPGIEPTYPVSPELAGGLSTWEAHQAQKVDPLIEQVGFSYLHGTYDVLRSDSRLIISNISQLEVVASAMKEGHRTIIDKAGEELLGLITCPHFTREDTRVREIKGLAQGHYDLKRQKQKSKPVLLVPQSLFFQDTT